MVFGVMSILAGLLAVMADSGMRAYRNARREHEIVRGVSLAFEMLRRDLLGAIDRDPATGNAIAGVNFIGIDQTSSGRPADQLRFIVFTSPEAAGRGDMTSINYRFETVNGVGRLSRAFRAMTSAGIPPLNLTGQETFEPLAVNATSFNVEYMENAGDNFQTSLASSSPDAYNAATEGKLPRAVRMTVTVQPPDSKERSFTQTVMFPLD